MLVLDNIGPTIQGCTSCIRRRFSSRRVVQERDTCSDVSCFTGLLRCQQSDYTLVLGSGEIVSFVSCDKKYKYNRRMELRQIRSFLSIAETLHFSRSAELIHLSQPALSLQIKALEEEIGVRLFVRDRRKTTLTAAGLAFRDDATAAVSQLDQAVRRARLAKNGKLGLIQIGFISTAGNELVPNIVRQFRTSNPDVELSLRNILTTDQIEMLNSGSLDIGFLRLPIGEHPELEVVGVHSERFVVVTPSFHKLAKRKKVGLRELSGEDFVMYERTYAPGFHDLVFGMLNDAAVVPNVCQSAGQMPTLISLVDSGMGISILPASAVKHSGASVAVCEITDMVPMSEIGIAVNRGNRAAIIGNFMSFTLEMLNHTRSRSGKKRRRRQVQM
jgi:DNA-binding transcriptional LysR family regulator